MQICVNLWNTRLIAKLFCLKGQFASFQEELFQFTTVPLMMIKISCIYQIIDKFPIVGSLLNYFLKLNIFQDRKRRYLPHCCSDIVINRTYKSFKYKVTWKYVHSPFKVSCSQLIIQIICASQILCDNVHTFKCVNYYQFFCTWIVHAVVCQNANKKAYYIIYIFCQV